jgi:nucleoside-diphosphate-sugar epimerase
MTSVAVVGASGFVGRHVADALRARNVAVVAVRAPRLVSSARSVDALIRDLDSYAATAVDLATVLSTVDVVINAAGQATAVGGSDDALFGANAVLPAVVALAAARVGARFVHVSSAAVQGRRLILDETSELAPFSPYSASKALGEELLRAVSADAIIFRPTSVHGMDRDVTRTLIRYARGPFPLVAAPGTDVTPQVDVRNVADAIAFVALSPESPPSVVLQPSEGFTTTSLLRALGATHVRTIPRAPARLLVAVLFLLGGLAPPFAGVARRLEMLWFGQAQKQGWLADRWHPVTRLEHPKDDR